MEQRLTLSERDKNVTTEATYSYRDNCGVGTCSSPPMNGLYEVFDTTSTGLKIARRRCEPILVILYKLRCY